MKPQRYVRELLTSTSFSWKVKFFS